MVLADLFREIRARLDQLPAEVLARAACFVKRKPRKIPIPALLAALVALGAETALSLERLASVIGLAAGVPYSKQAFHERLSALAAWSTGSSTRVARLALLAEPPSIDLGEVTDKGSLNQRALLANRYADVEALYASELKPHVVRL